ncbi:MAG TPA: alpha/beta hydrolase [Sideroxyarcus sp.]|nr:alpha/beta hydrolase [Sideroxyarcus sp.]
MGEPQLLKTTVGDFAVRDFGGNGPDLLFVHGTGHNLEVWNPLASCLTGEFRMATFDMRGHGQTPAQSSDPEQYWRDIAEVASALGLNRPLLIGHSTGGYAVSAHAANGGDCSGIVILDGFVLDGRKTPEETKDWYLPREQLWDLFRYGWVASPDEVDRYVAEVCRKAPGDWLNSGVDVALVEAFTRRSFLHRNGTCLRRPTMEEIAMVSVPDPAQPIYPALDLYERISVPAGFVLASNGLYGNREADIAAVVAARANRRFLKLDCGHNVHMQKVAEVADFVLRYFHQ